MVTESKDRFVNTKTPIDNDQAKGQPHERDESPDAQAPRPRGVIAQAAEDLEQGLADTSSASGSGMEQLAKPGQGASGQANPLPGRARDMRDHDAADTRKGKDQ